jgi:hypothetical protein
MESVNPVAITYAKNGVLDAIHQFCVRIAFQPRSELVRIVRWFAFVRGFNDNDRLVLWDILNG